MDEINVFLYGAILIADENSELYSAEQQRHASLLRWISAGAAVVIVLVVLVVAFTVHRNRQELKQKVLDELEKGEKKFLIDFSQTGYIDSSGLGVLVSLSKKIREQGGELRLANLNDDLKTLFELTKLDTLFQIADTRERALESF